MSFRRIVFALPFACLALVAALTFSTSSLGTRYGFGVEPVVAYQLPDLTLPAVAIDHAAIVEERSRITVPADGHKLAYLRANTPLST